MLVSDIFNIENIAFFLGYGIMVVSFLIGIVLIGAFVVSRVQDYFPYFIGYKGLVSMDDKRFNKWIETVKHMRDKKISKYIKENLE